MKTSLFRPVKTGARQDVNKPMKRLIARRTLPWRGSESACKENRRGGGGWARGAARKMLMRQRNKAFAGLWMFEGESLTSCHQARVQNPFALIQNSQSRHMGKHAHVRTLQAGKTHMHTHTDTHTHINILPHTHTHKQTCMKTHAYKYTLAQIHSGVHNHTRQCSAL